MTEQTDFRAAFHLDLAIRDSILSQTLCFSSVIGSSMKEQGETFVLWRCFLELFHWLLLASWTLEINNSPSAARMEKTASMETFITSISTQSIYIKSRQSMTYTSIYICFIPQKLLNDNNIMERLRDKMPLVWNQFCSSTCIKKSPNWSFLLHCH